MNNKGVMINLKVIVINAIRYVGYRKCVFDSFVIIVQGIMVFIN